MLVSQIGNVNPNLNQENNLSLDGEMVKSLISVLHG